MKKHIFILAVSAVLLFGGGLSVASSQFEPGINVMQVDYDVGVMAAAAQIEKDVAQCSDNCHVGYKNGAGSSGKWVDKPGGKWLASLIDAGSSAVSVWGKRPPESRRPGYG